MKTNVEKVLERDQKLSELDDRADALQQGASQFEQQAGKLKRKFWLQNLKVRKITKLPRCLLQKVSQKLHSIESQSYHITLYR